MIITIRFDDYPNLEVYENDLLDTLHLLQSLEGKRFRDDERVHVALRLLKSMWKHHREHNWPYAYLLVSSRPEKHEEHCSCGECFDPPLLHKKRVCYRAAVYLLHGQAMTQKNYGRLSAYLQEKEELYAFSGKTYRDTLAYGVHWCDEHHYFLYDPVARKEQEF